MNPTTVSRILDLLADGCAREKRLAGQWAYTYHGMTAGERVAFDLFLVRMDDLLARQAGQPADRFRDRVIRMVHPETGVNP